MEVLFIIIVLVLSVIIHEVSHGYAASLLGDPTARLAGRLTLNPIPHIDLFGSILLPALLLFTNSGFLIGWAKPVPYNPHNLRWPHFGEAAVAAAGPVANIAIALTFGLLIRASDTFVFITPGTIELLSSIVFVNIVLALFNLVPIPPLDGSKVLAAILPYSLARAYGNLLRFVEGYGFFAAIGLILIFLLLFSGPFVLLIRSIFSLFTGLS